jgi:metal-dependent HD superfamily phosphatase/phosphodiesterase
MALQPTPESTPIGLPLFEQLRRDPDILALIEKADQSVATLGYTDHGRRHVNLVGVNAARLLTSLGHDERTCDLAAVAGLLHDIGNIEGREGHARAGALMSYPLLIERGVPPQDAAAVKDAIANHDEIESGQPVNVPSAALIVADKADIHRSRVRTRRRDDFDIHDRVNFAVTKSRLHVHAERKHIELMLAVDDSVASGREVAELFAVRFTMSGSAANFLGCSFVVDINGRGSLQGGGTNLGER